MASTIINTSNRNACPSGGRTALILTIFALVSLSGETLFATEPADCVPLTADARARLSLDAYYQKVIEDRGIVFTASANVSDFGLAEACFLVDQMLAGNPPLRRRLADAGLRVAVMAPTEMTTDLPEHRRLRPKSYWDRRARGLGASRKNPVVSCGEENLLGLEGDPYASENILIHEFAHAVDKLGMASVDGFKVRLNAAYAHAMESGRWKGTYAATDAGEYWAEGAQSWFECNARPNSYHNDIRTRDQVKTYDPELSALLVEAFGDLEWRYAPPRARTTPGHLSGLDRMPVRRFEWPPELAAAAADEQREEPSAPTQ